MWPSLIDILTASSSLSLRLGAYVFLRWIPGNVLPPAIYTLAVVYLSSFAISYLTTSPYRVVAEELDVRASEEDEREPSQHVRIDQSDSKHPTVRGEAVKTRETALLEERGPQPLRTLLTGLPSPTSPRLSLLTAAINLLLTAVVLDVVYRGRYWHASSDLSFARAGYVDDTSAKILIREPNGAPVRLSYRNVDQPGDDDSWTLAGSVPALSKATDFTTSMTITGLRPETRYQYSTSTNHSGSFVTAPSPGHRPSRNSGTYTFLFSSCLKPRFPYNPLAHPLDITGLRNVARWVPELQPQFMLFLGDFIYIDTPKRFGTDIEDYRRDYRMNYNSPDWRPASRYLPWIHVYDDHDIENDWDRNTTGVYETAAQAWQDYHGSVNPPVVPGAKTYYSFSQGPASFFLLDTRRYRSCENAAPPESPEKTMLGPEQLSHFLAWLREAPSPGIRWKIVASSVPLTKNWRFNNKDTWGGYLFERQKVLEAMWDAASGGGGVGVVVVSGDRHEFAATSFPPPAGRSRWTNGSTAHEFSTSPLSQFYLPTRTYRQKDDQDVMLKYVPDGNSKFGAIDIRVPEEGDGESTLEFRLFVDGKERWNHVLGSPPPPPPRGES
ncbi:MAG: hypothetical protein M1816_000324 [Peltula sp. TS41687]|nr:MAG: hypothetical protein M1816_000324 [Peltula sp. TS41687]